MNKLLVVAVMLIALLLLRTMFLGNSKMQDSESYSADKKMCEMRGVSYFKEIGSFPYLSDGRKADEVAKLRCARTSTAFP